MIQRIQTLYLIVASLSLFAVFFLDFGNLTYSGEAIPFNIYGFEINGENMLSFPIMITIGISLLLSIGTILLFKNRKLQLKINMINMFMSIANIAIVLIFVYSLKEENEFIYGLGIFMLVIHLVFCMMAHRGIKNDEKLIRSLDRLR